MNLTKIALDNNRLTIMVVVVILVMGLLTYNNLSRDAMPPYTVRICNIVTQFPGATPERVEELVTDPIEETVQELPELKTVTSASRTGLSVVSVEVAPSIVKDDLQPVWDRLRRKLESIQNELPSEIRGPDVQDDGLGDTYGIQVGMETDGVPFAQMKEYAEEIRDEFIALDDAAEVEISGIQDEQIYIEFDNARLAQLGISANQLGNIISATNIVFPGGEVALEDERIVLEPTGNFEDVEDIKSTVISLGESGQTVKLGDITTITRAYKNPIDRKVRINGKPGLVIATSLKKGANLVDLGKAIDQKITEYNAILPVGIHLARIADQDYYVQQKIADFVNNVIQSVIVVLAVMLLFLGLRTGLVVATLIPLAMIMTLWLMGLFDIGLNQVSLAALIMALGLLVDNAIVVSESMLVKMENGDPPRIAAIESCRELIVPLLISSLTTSAAFIAFFLAEDIMSEIMGPIFVVITMALLSSWIMAMTVITMLGVAFIRVKEHAEEEPKRGIDAFFDRLNNRYKDLLLWSLRRPVTIVMVLIGLFFGSLFLFGFLPFIFFPDSDRNLVTVDINLPLGTKIERTEEVVRIMERFFQEELQTGKDRQSGIDSWTAFISEGPESYDLGYQPGEANTGYAHMLINTSSYLANSSVIQAIDDFAYRSLPNAEVTASPLAGGGGGGADVEVRISGSEPEVLFDISNQIKLFLNDMLSTKNIKDDWGPKIKKVVIDIDEDKASNAGVTNQDIAVSLRTALSGYDAGNFREGDNNIPIVMRTEGSQEWNVTQLESLNIFSQSTGRNVPLVQVASIRIEWDFAKIKRRDLRRTITVECDAKTGYTARNITDELTPYLDELAKDWPRGYTYELGGESEQSAEAMGAVADQLPLAGFIILLLLIGQFNSIRKTGIVLAAIPMGIIGVVLGLLLFRSSFGFMAYLGVISLAGIVINNAIVLIDRIRIEEEELGKSPWQAIIDGSQQRFRPILLTTFTTTLGLIPLYLGGGLMWEPMAISIMVGLLFATVITLIFVPALYKLLFKISEEKAIGKPLTEGLTEK